jgi:hypothetical protein
MATPDEIYTAIRNANAAGDSASVQKLGAYLQTMSTPTHEQVAAKIDGDAITKGAQNFNAGAGFLDNLNAGAGKAISDLAQGVGQKIGLVSNADVAETRRLDAPLMDTGAAKIGNIGANVAMLAPASLLPGAATVPGAAAIGGIVGALQPSASTGEGFLNTALGAAGGAGGQAIANKAAGTVAFQQGQNAAKTAAGAQKVGAAKAASDAGYVVPPEDIGGGLGTKILEGAGGKIKTAQVASQQNQTVSNNLAKKALGIPESEPLTQQALADVRKAAGDAYNVVKGSGTITADKGYTDALDKIAQQATTAAQAFPGAVKSDIPALVQGLKEPSFSADGAVEMTKILRANADKAYAGGDKGLGKANKDAADALESMMERHLQAQGMPDALKDFQDARQTIAKTYTVGKSLNSTTGDVSAPALAKALDKGKPLSGDLLTIAQAGQAFPKALQALKEAPKTFSPLDMAYALKNLGTGNVKGIAADVATLGLRPAARSISLSGPMQRNMLQNAGQPVPANAMARLLANNELLIPAGITGGITGANALTAALNR